MFALLSSMYLCKPTGEALANWRQLLEAEPLAGTEELAKALHAINPDSEQELEDILWEYTRLFIGPYRLAAPPWESVYTSPKRLLMQEAVDRVQKFYAEAGVQLGDTAIMPDHAGIELNFVAILLEKIKSDPDREPRYRELADRFAVEHLKRWLPAFSVDLEKASVSPLYKELARATGELVRLL